LFVDGILHDTDQHFLGAIRECAPFDVPCLFGICPSIWRVHSHDSASQTRPYGVIPALTAANLNFFRDVLYTKDAQPFLISGSGTLGWDQVRSCGTESDCPCAHLTHQRLQPISWSPEKTRLSCIAVTSRIALRTGTFDICDPMHVCLLMERVCLQFANIWGQSGPGQG
jgi:hypothetical protein